MTSTGTGWTKDIPRNNHFYVVGWYFQRRLSNHAMQVVEINQHGNVWRIGANNIKQVSDLRATGDYEWLGPVSPSDAEQLVELRKALISVVNGMGCWCKIPFVNASEDRGHESRCLAARAALNPSHLQQETQ